MRQSTYTFGVLMFALLVYITSKGQLPMYLSLFTRKNAGGASSSSGSSGGGNILSQGAKLFSDFSSLFSGSSTGSSDPNSLDNNPGVDT